MIKIFYKIKFKANKNIVTGKKYQNNIKGIVGSSIMLGVGGTTIGAFSGMEGVPANLATKTIGTSANMMGAVIPATMGMGVMGFMNEQQRKLRKVNKHKKKH